MKQIQDLELEIEQWQTLQNYLIIYIPLVVIPRFKTDRGGQYFTFLSTFAQNHIKSCNNNINQWQAVLDATKTSEALEF